MNISRFILTVLALAALFCTNAFSQTDMPKNDASTLALVQLCKNSEDTDAQNFCFGFGEGVYQAYLANRNPKLKPMICFSSEGGTREMILQQYLAWIQANPQMNQERAAKSLMKFFEAEYRCSSK